MHPAPSIIFFTVLSGLGLGMMVWLGIGLGPDAPGFGFAGAALALVIAGIGGACSTLHLANPVNAWRAFSQWRSSWLSREACLMVATIVVFGVYAAAWAFGGVRLWGLGWLSALLAGGTIYATAMIYAQIRAVPRWSVTPTPALFLVLALSGGLLATRMVQGLAGDYHGLWQILPVLAIAAGVMVWWQTQAAGAGRGVEGSSIASATGLGQPGRVRLFEAPHTGGNYLLDEMAYKVARARAYQLRWLGALLGFILPLVLALLSLGLGAWVLVLALICHVAGMLALRWLFFAEAEHVQALYYGHE
ncbi:dimethyl sulfoxide reductase anchor subunit [Rhodobacteraceae bacterium NNCM2]|nr:dimethyl sulfoxide reductase anchor subunit [Coraliihabitans acroporae]